MVIYSIWKDLLSSTLVFQYVSSSPGVSTKFFGRFIKLWMHLTDLIIPESTGYFWERWSNLQLLEKSYKIH